MMSWKVFWNLLKMYICQPIFDLRRVTTNHSSNTQPVTASIHQHQTMSHRGSTSVPGGGNARHHSKKRNGSHNGSSSSASGSAGAAAAEAPVITDPRFAEMHYEPVRLAQLASCRALCLYSAVAHIDCVNANRDIDGHPSTSTRLLWMIDSRLCLLTQTFVNSMVGGWHAVLLSPTN